MAEIFKKIEEFPGYEASNLGNVKSLKYNKERILKPREDSGGYYLVSLYKNKKQHDRLISILVYKAFNDDYNPEMQIDHIDHDRHNNKLSNLRMIPRNQNCWNQKSRGGTSKFKGVSWHKKSSKWQVVIQANNKQIHIGLFISEIDAARAYNQAAKEFHGEYAVLNEV